MLERLAGNTALKSELGAALGAWIGIKRHRRTLWKLDQDGFALRHGRWWQTESRVPASRVQHLDLKRGPLQRGLRLERTNVGDRYVVERMRGQGFNLGGEQSGHIVMTDYATTGDGLIAGLQFLAAMTESGRLASDLVTQFEPVPQMLKNVRYQAGADPLSKGSVQAEIARAEARLNGSGRVLIRKSGTEPLIRVMAEAEDEVVLREVVEGIVAAVEHAA